MKCAQNGNPFGVRTFPCAARADDVLYEIWRCRFPYEFIVFIEARYEDAISIDDGGSRALAERKTCKEGADIVRSQLDRQQVDDGTIPDHGNLHDHRVTFDERPSDDIRYGRLQGAYGFMLVAIERRIHGFQLGAPWKSGIDELQPAIWIVHGDVDVEPLRDYDGIAIKCLEIIDLESVRGRQRLQQVLHSQQLAIKHGRDLACRLLRILLELGARRFRQMVRKQPRDDERWDRDEDD